ncbi:MAG TPA: response regulator [Actinomycetota bacterium]|nr:response regulator [Actinomycetota bacterium]
MDGRVLIVEDHPTMRGALRLLLESEGLTVQEVADGGRALEVVAAERPDVVFLDLNIPGTSGAQVLSAIKGDPSTAGVAVIVITAEGEEGRAPAMLLGADAYLTKPFSPNELLRTVELALEGSGPTAASP